MRIPESAVVIRRTRAHKALRLIEEIEQSRVTAFMNQRQMGDLREVKAELRLAVAADAEFPAEGTDVEVVNQKAMEQFDEPGEIRRVPQTERLSDAEVTTLLGRPFRCDLKHGHFDAPPLAREVKVSKCVIHAWGERFRATRGDVVMRLAEGGFIFVPELAFQANMKVIAPR